MAITQADLVEVMADAYGDGASKANMTKALYAVFDKIGEGMENGEDTRIRGFGTFTTTKTKERTGKNPATQETITIPAGTKPKFKPAAALKERVNK